MGLRSGPLVSVRYLLKENERSRAWSLVFPIS